MNDDREVLQASADLNVAAAEEILAILAERMADKYANPADWTPCTMISVLVSAAWQASKSTLWPLPPDQYVALMRAHADTVERLHCPPEYEG